MTPQPADEPAVRPGGDEGSLLREPFASAVEWIARCHEASNLVLSEDTTPEDFVRLLVDVTSEHPIWRKEPGEEGEDECNTCPTNEPYPQHIRRMSETFR